jgi:hypothetical protein
MVPMGKTEQIRLLIEDQGRIVWKVFEGEWLVGWSDLAPPGDWKDKIFFWRVAQSTNGKLIVGRSSDIIGPAELAIYATRDEMRANVPKRIFESAEKAAGLRVDPVYPEEPLEV